MKRRADKEPRGWPTWNLAQEWLTCKNKPAKKFGETNKRKRKIEGS